MIENPEYLKDRNKIDLIKLSSTKYQITEFANISEFMLKTSPTEITGRGARLAYWRQFDITL